MKRIVIATGLLAASCWTAQAATLDTVKQRGMLVCGVSAGFVGFSTPDSQVNYKGLDVDYCRALAAGVLGDATKVRYGGNYGEIFERNVGKSSPLKLDRGLNATWNKGGLMYALPFK